MFADDIILYLGFPGSSDLKECACNVRDLGSIPRLGGSTGERNGYPLECSCLENPVKRGTRRLQFTWPQESEVTEQLTLSLNSAYIEKPKNSTKNC